MFPTGPERRELPDWAEGAAAVGPADEGQTGTPDIPADPAPLERVIPGGRAAGGAIKPQTEALGPGMVAPGAPELFLVGAAPAILAEVAAVRVKAAPEGCL